ncbi:MAG: tRNA lysidine(34) synthetase TilS [Rickettsiales bacterium]
MNIIDRFFKYVNRLGPYEEKARICVSVSGGSDSLALTFLLNEWCKLNGFQLSAVTIDHSLRRESKDETLRLHNLLAMHSIHHEYYKIKPNTIKTNKQETARIERYKLLAQHCKKNKIHHLFTGHTLNDNVENFFIRLTRGTSLKGLKGINKKIILNDIRVLRPLLSFHREDLKFYLNSIDVQWISDPSNKDLKYKRNLARNILNSEGFVEMSNQTDKSVIFDRINDVIIETQEVYSTNIQALNKFLAQHITIYNSGYCIIKLDAFKEQTKDLAVRCLSTVINTIGGKDQHGPRKKSLQLIVSHISLNKKGVFTLGNAIIKINKKQNKIFIYPEHLSNTIELRENEIVFCGQYVLKSVQRKNFSVMRLNKTNAPDLPNTIRKSAFKIEAHSGKKLVPFTSKGYYSDLDFEYAAKRSVSSQTVG